MRRFVNPTVRQLRRERASAARLEYKPVIKAARDEMRISRTAERQLNEFYDGYRNAREQAASRTRAGTDDLYNRSRDTAADLGRRYDDRIAEMSADDAKSAEIRGAAKDTSAERRSLAGESQRQNLMNADAQLLARLGSAAEQFQRNVALASNTGQRLDLRRERNIRRNARNDIRDAKKERNAKISVLRGEQRGAEREYQLQRQTLAKDRGYQDAMRYVADQGVARAQASAAGQVRAAGIYSNAKIKSAQLYNAGGGKKVKGADVLRAQDLLRAEMKKRQLSWQDVRRNQQRWYAVLTDRGADPVAARVAVRRLLKNKLGKGGAWAGKRR